MQDATEFVTLVTQPGCPGVSWGGDWYPTTNGRVRVPAAAVPELTRAIHGNTLAPKDEAPRGLAQTLHLKHGKRA